MNSGVVRPVRFAGSKPVTRITGVVEIVYI